MIGKRARQSDYRRALGGDGLRVPAEQQSLSLRGVPAAGPYPSRSRALGVVNVRHRTMLPGTTALHSRQLKTLARLLIAPAMIRHNGPDQSFIASGRRHWLLQQLDQLLQLLAGDRFALAHFFRRLTLRRRRKKGCLPPSD